MTKVTSFLNAAGIHARLSDGSMPCDDSWGSAKITLFRQMDG